MRVLTAMALILGFAGTAAPLLTGRAGAAERVIRDDLLSAFQAEGTVGTMSVYEVAADRWTLVGAERAATRYVPASTFKIVNSLIALETGAVRDADEVIPYGGKPQSVKAWERDMPMREAFQASAVPIYQELARRIGLEGYRTWLPRLGFGNGETGGALERFWLDGPLETSAIEQADFVARLAIGRLPVSERSQAVVRELMRIEAREGRTLFAKTGWHVSAHRKIGWWTGYVVSEGRTTAFSLNMDMADVTTAPKRLSIGKAILGRLGLY